MTLRREQWYLYSFYFLQLVPRSKIFCADVRDQPVLQAAYFAGWPSDVFVLLRSQRHWSVWARVENNDIIAPKTKHKKYNTELPRKVRLIARLGFHSGKGRDIFRRVRKTANGDCWLRHVSPSVRQSSWNKSVPSNGFSSKWYPSILRQSVQKIQVSLKSDKNSGYFAWIPIYRVFHDFRA